MVTEATNQWTGATFEALGGVRVHFAPFQAEPVFRKSDEPLEGVTTSSDGFLADKDSGRASSTRSGSPESACICSLAASPVAR